MAEQYDQIAEEFVQNKASFFSVDKDLAREFILSHLQDVEGKVLIDVGCGAGPDVVVYETMPLKAVYGVDPSEKMIEKAREVVTHPENLSVAGFEKIDMPDESVDFVVSRFALHYVRDTAAAYREVARILKPGGVLIQVADHPVASGSTGSFFEKDGQKYVKVRIYDKVIVEFPYKNFTDYFSAVFLKLFKIEEILEWQGKDGDHQNGPNALGFVAIKK